MSILQQIQRGLRDTYVALDSHDYDVGGDAVLEVAGDLRNPHAEFRLVGVLDGIGDRELSAGWAKTGDILGCCVDGYVENASGFYEFLSGEDYLLIFPNCGAEFLLDIAYTGGGQHLCGLMEGVGQTKVLA